MKTLQQFEIYCGLPMDMPKGYQIIDWDGTNNIMVLFPANAAIDAWQKVTFIVELRTDLMSIPDGFNFICERDGKYLFVR